MASYNFCDDVERKYGCNGDGKTTIVEEIFGRSCSECCLFVELFSYQKHSNYDSTISIKCFLAKCHAFKRFWKFLSSKRFEDQAGWLKWNVCFYTYVYILAMVQDPNATKLYNPKATFLLLMMMNKLHLLLWKGQRPKAKMNDKYSK